MNSANNRLPTGHRVDTDQAVQFTFDGKTYQGFKGDTLASALLANGVRIVGRSFKLHRPRGLMTAGNEEPNGLVQLEEGAFTEPNVRATLIPLYDGLKAKSQNAWPNAKWDIFGILGFFHRMFPASFYYKSMMWPSWHWYEWAVRRLAGLGTAPNTSDPQRYCKRNCHCDVLIVGGGPAGFAAARSAAQSGLRVILVDDQEEFGGNSLASAQQINGMPARKWIAEAVASLSAVPDVTLLKRTSVSGYYDHNFLIAAERLTNHQGPKTEARLPRERLWRIRAKQVVLATGAHERPLAFANNDKPGIMLAGAVRTYLNRYGVAVGQRVAIVTNNDSAYQCALDLHDVGINVAVIVDTRKDVDGPVQKEADGRGITLYTGYSIAKVYGYRELRAIGLAEHKGGGVLGAPGPIINCDLLAMSGGWTPTIHLYSQAGGSLDYAEDRACLVPKSCAQAVQVVGSANGAFTLKACLQEGREAGVRAAAKIVEKSETSFTTEIRDEPEAQPIEAYWYTKDAATDKQWLDFQYDVKVSDIELSTLENMISVEHVKRYTTNGMSIDQGKTSNVNALAVMAELSGRPIMDVGTTKFRPPYQPVTIGAFAGRDIGEFYRPRMYLPAHEWHKKNGAKFIDYGWQRPEYYPKGGEDREAAVQREVLASRAGVGIFDSSPLGKIEVRGPDAGEFLNRLYINNLKTLKVGRSRYGLMANEKGVVIDDGVVVRLAEDHYLLHTTTGGAPMIGLMLEEWRAEWPHFEVFIANVTTQWANITLNGPLSNNVMMKLQSDIDFGKDAFPHATMQIGMVEGVPARVMRASFTGEMSYEINVPARYGMSLWARLMDLGTEFDMTPYGTEALNVMRVEKGHLIVGVDTLGTTNPLDIGWGGPISKKKGDFVGKRSLSRKNDIQEERHHFVGLRPKNAHDVMPVGSHIVANASPSTPETSLGYVTSSVFSPSLNASVGLGLLMRGRARLGEELYAYTNGKTIPIIVSNPIHYDIKGERIHG